MEFDGDDFTEVRDPVELHFSGADVIRQVFSVEPPAADAENLTAGSSTIDRLWDESLYYWNISPLSDPVVRRTILCFVGALMLFMAVVHLYRWQKDMNILRQRAKKTS